MSFKSGVTTRVDNAQAILDALRSLTKKDVLVGIPEEDSEREDVPFGNDYLDMREDNDARVDKWRAANER